jgi:DNA-binding MarR family transcriptional regulator
MPAKGNKIRQLIDMRLRLLERLKITETMETCALEALSNEQRRLIANLDDNITQGQIALKMGMSQSNVSRMLDRITRNLPVLLALCAQGEHQASRDNNN